MSVGSGGIREHGSGLSDAGSLIFVDAGTPSLKPFEILGHCAHSSGAMLPMTAVALALSSSGTAAVQLMLPRWVESPTNFCGMSFAARMNCARSDSVNGRQLTISLRSFHIPMRFTLWQSSDIGVSRWVLGQTPSSSVSRMMVTGPSLASRTAHVGAESSFFYFESLRAQGVVESVPCLFGVRGRSGFHEASGGCLCARPRIA